MTETAPRATVVHVNDVDLSAPDVVYIGRAVPRRKLARSIWANPHKVERGASELQRLEAITRYAVYLYRDRPDLRPRLAELRGKRLACWCSPNACHGDFLARAVNMMQESDERATSPE